MRTTLETPAEARAARHDALAVWGIAALGFAALVIPTMIGMFRTVWSTEEQGHGPIVLGISIWLIWRRWPELNSNENVRPKPAIAWPMIALACLAYAFGRSQAILILEVGSLILMGAALVLLLKGPTHLKSIWFAVFFMLFMLPLPSAVVDALTQPMKLAVSYVAENILYSFGYPISRTGVLLQIGQYQLMVADACAGLHTLFTLEALGLLYLNVVRSSSAFRNIGLAFLIVPISFTANVIRVMVLTLITYYFGDAAGQGFLHGFAGMVLFLTALLLIMSVDSILRFGHGIVRPKVAA